MQIVMIDPKKLKPYFRNPRNNNKAVSALVKIIPRVGFNVPIVVDKDLVIIKGHSRWNASRILELKEVPIIISESTDEQNNRDRILDNAIHDLTEWDFEKLKTELDLTNVNLEDYSTLSWVNKIINVTPIKEKNGEKLFSVLCPNCKAETTYRKKELIKE